MVHLDADLTGPDGYNKAPLEHSLGVKKNVCPHSVPYPLTPGGMVTVTFFSYLSTHSPRQRPQISP